MNLCRSCDHLVINTSCHIQHQPVLCELITTQLDFSIRNEDVNSEWESKAQCITTTRAILQWQFEVMCGKS